MCFRVRGSYPLRRGFPDRFSYAINLVTPWKVWCLRRQVPRPRTSNATRLGPLARFRLFPFRSPLLRESRLLSFPRGTEMFQFPRFPLPALCVQAGVTPHDECRVSPFGHPRIKAWSTAPRGFSQPPTSFIGSRRQGIHRWLFVAWKNKDARARYAVLKVLVLALQCSSEPPRLSGTARAPRARAARRCGVRDATPSKRKRGRWPAPAPIDGRDRIPTTAGRRGDSPTSAPTGSVSYSLARMCQRRERHSLERR